MKHLIKIILFMMMNLTFANHCLEQFGIKLKSKWQELDNKCDSCINFGGKWILVGSIIFEKRDKDPIAVEEITLHWRGDNLDNLIGSLYKKTPGKDFLAIENNLICDGIWNEKKQTLIFDFDEKENLGPTTIFYLVLTVPENIELILKKGHFCLENDCLPRPFKQSLHNEKLFLAINDHPKKSSLN